MSVYRRGKIFWFKFHFGGHLVRESTRQSKKRVAQQMEATHRSRLALGEVGIAPRKRITLRALAETFKTFIATRSADRPETIKFYNAKLRCLLAFKPIAEKPIAQIDETLIESYVQHRRKTVAPTAVNRELATLRRMLQLASKQWKLIGVPPQISMLPGERNRTFVLSRPDELRYLAAAPEPLRSAAVVMLDTGLRVGEVSRLTAADVSFSPAHITIRRGKTENAKRTLAMTARVGATLEARPAESYVFPGRKSGTAVSVSWLEKQHNLVRSQLGLSKEFVIHSLRHTFGTRLGELGTDAFTIKRLMGHSSVTISEKYVHPGSASTQKAFDRLEAAAAEATIGHSQGHSSQQLAPIVLN